MTPIYISATVQDSGKTAVSLSLMQILRARGKNPGYIKPVGQHYVLFKGEHIDEDAVLMHEVFGLTDPPHCLSPIAIERGFTRKFIEHPDAAPLERDIAACVVTLLEAHSSVIVEGTGHAGVGSCFGLSNARVAELLGAKVVIVTGGGIGRPLDEVALNLALFRQQNVEVLGVILNKVLAAKYDKITGVAGKGLALLGTRLLGAIPYDAALTSFTMGQLAEELECDVPCGRAALTNRIEHTVVAAMEPQNVVRHIRANTLVIAPGDRLDNILLAVMVMSQDYEHSGGLVLTGGIELQPKIAALVENSSIPVLLSQEDTFTVSARMADLGFKIRSFDGDKIDRLHKLVEAHLDVDYILAALADGAEPPPDRPRRNRGRA